MAAKYLECKPTYISTATTTNIQVAGRNIYLHTVVIPIALTGTATFRDMAGSPVTYFVFPIGAVGTFTFDCDFPNGLDVVTSAGDKLIVNTIDN